MRLRLKKIKPHLTYIILFIVIFSFFYGAYYNLNWIVALEPLTFYLAKIECLGESMKTYHDIFPLWNPYTMGGQPYIGGPDNPQMTSIIGLLLLIFDGSNYVYTLLVLIDLFLAGVMMYLLLMYLTKDKNAAFLSAIVYVFNPWISTNVAAAGLTTLNVYWLVPLLMIFVIKAFKKDNWVFNSVIAGLIFSLLIRFSTGLKVFLFVALLFGTYIIVYVIGKNFRNKLIKAFFVVLIIVAITFGTNAQFILPEKEFLDMTARGHLSWEQSSGGKFPLKDLMSFVEPFYEGWPQFRREGASRNIGIVAFILFGFAVFKYWRNKKVLTFSLGALISILIVTGSPFYYLLWKYVPPFHSFRHTHRAAVLYIFTMSVLVGYGFLALRSVLKEKWDKLNDKMIFVVVTLLVLLNVVVLGISPYAIEIGDITPALEKDYLMQEVSKDEAIFRIKVFETNGIDWGTEFSYLRYGIGGLYGNTGIWLTEWMNEFLAVGLRQRAKFWGIFNVKYVQSLSNISVEGLEFVEKFEKCTECYPVNPNLEKMFGNYLFENKKFLPRAYFVDDSVLVVGEEISKRQTILQFMLDENFDPSKSVFIKGKDMLNQYSFSELEKYSSIVLVSGSVDENSGSILKRYVDGGGVVLPDLLGGETVVTADDVKEMFGGFNGSLREVGDENYITHKFGRYEVKVNGKKGFLVLSEKFSSFPGWMALADGKDLGVMKADGMITAVYVDNEYDSVMMEYMPRSVVIGRNITVFTFILVGIYFAWYIFGRRKKVVEGDDVRKT